VNLTKKGIVVVTTFIIIAQSLVGEEQKESTRSKIFKKTVGVGLCAALCYYVYHCVAFPPFAFFSPGLRQAQRNEQAIGEVKTQVIVLESKVDTLQTDVKKTVIPTIATLDSKADVLQKQVDTLQTAVQEDVIEPLKTLQIQSTLTLQKLDTQSAEIKGVAASLRNNTTAVCAVGIQLGNATKKIDSLQMQTQENSNLLNFHFLQAQNHTAETKSILQEISYAFKEQQTLLLQLLPRGPGAQQQPLSIVYPTTDK
jgi:hypothetical protein